MKSRLLAIGLMLGCLCAAPGVFAGVGDDDAPHGNVSAFLWPFAIDGHASVRGTSANIANDGTQLAGVISGEQRFEHWSLGMDFFWGRNSNSADVPGGQHADYIGEYFSGTFGAFLTVLDKQPENRDQRYVLDGFLGVRANNHNYNLQFDPDYTKNKSDSKSWVDPTVGARFTMTFAPNWVGEFYGDAGGFGIGSASELSVAAHATLKWLVGSSFSVLAGYRYFDLESEHQNGDTQTVVDVRMSGPALGAEFRF